MTPCTARLRQATRRSSRGVGLVVTAAWLGLSGLVLAEDRQSERPRVIELERTVEKLIVGARPLPIRVNEWLEYDDQIRTGPGAWATITLGPEGALDVGSDTTIVITEADRLEVDLSRGRLIVALARAFRGGLRLRAPSVTLGTRGTLFEVQVLFDGTARVSVLEGEVDLEGLGLTVREGSQVLVKPDGEVSSPSPISLWEPSTLQQAAEDPAPEDSPILDQVNPRLFTRD